MKTYFIRHTKQLDISKDTLDNLIKNNLIAIHFPFEKSLDEEYDSKSINPDDYDLRNHKEAIKTLNKLSNEGGYVCAEYWTVGGAKLGKVDPGTKIRIFEGEWGTKENRKAILKTLPLKNVRQIHLSEYLIISSGRPRQGTIKIWRNSGDRIKYLVENIPLKPTLFNLSPTQQEVFCSEYLRYNLDTTGMLPSIESYLLPIGRTLIAVDIAGLSPKGQKIYAQVTYFSFEDSKEKFNNLKRYLSKDTQLILFCQCEKPQLIDNIIVYPLQLAFDIYSKSDVGKKWLKSIFNCL
jgi:hypothetical protein